MSQFKQRYHRILRELSDQLVELQRPIRILDSIKWSSEIQAKFFAKHGKELPVIDVDYYKKNRLSFDIKTKQQDFYCLEQKIIQKIGRSSSAGSIMLRMCGEYRQVLHLLEARGRREFTGLSQKLYGSAEDAFYVDAPRLKDLAKTVSSALKNIQNKTHNELDKKKYNSEQAANLLNQRLSRYFGYGGLKKFKPLVKASDDIVADAAAGSEVIKIRQDAWFSERDLKILEVHEGWVHMGTTLNGAAQPICTFLSKGTPSSTATQEGLAILMEVFHFVSSPLRVQRLTDRITAIAMAEAGANFLEVFDFFQSEAQSPEESYNSAVRIFRGSLPEQGPFTKDLVYSKGFIIIYNYLRLAVQEGLIERLPLLFVGKTSLENQRLLANLMEEGLLVVPRYIPQQFKDLAALSCWMCYSVFLNKLDLSRIAIDYRKILEG